MKRSYVRIVQQFVKVRKYTEIIKEGSMIARGSFVKFAPQRLLVTSTSRIMLGSMTKETAPSVPIAIRQEICPFTSRSALVPRIRSQGRCFHVISVLMKPSLKNDWRLTRRNMIKLSSKLPSSAAMKTVAMPLLIRATSTDMSPSIVCS